MNKPVFLQKKEMHHLENDFEELLQRYEQSMARNESGYFDVEELEEIADYYLQRNRTKDSSRAVELGLRLHPMSSELLIRRARIYFALEDYQRAMQVVRRIEATEKNDVEVLMLKAALYISMEQTREAIELYNRLIDENPDETEDICFDAAVNCYTTVRA